MAKKKQEDELVICPVGKFLLDMQKSSWQKSEFVEHLNQSRIEILKAIRSLIDSRIERLEKNAPRKSARKATKINVE
jgi:hypothetical protein